MYFLSAFILTEHMINLILNIEFFFMKSNDEFIIIHEYERTIRSTYYLSSENDYEIIFENICFPRNKSLSIGNEYVSFFKSSTDNINYINTIFFILILSLSIQISYLKKDRLTYNLKKIDRQLTMLRSWRSR